MDRRSLDAYCRSRSGATSDFPYGPDVEVFRVAAKTFALLATDEPLRISLKCDPSLAEILRANHPNVTPGYHLNKRHWNTIVVDGSLSDGEIEDMVDHSYGLVVRGLPKGRRPPG